MSSLESFSGIGVYEMQSAASREVKRIMAEAGGDRLKADKIVLTKLHELNFITEKGLPVLSHICELGHAATGGNTTQQRHTRKSRRPMRNSWSTATRVPLLSPTPRAPLDPTCPAMATSPALQRWSTKSQAVTGKAPSPAQVQSSVVTLAVPAEPLWAPLSEAWSARSSTTAESCEVTTKAAGAR